MCEAETKGCGHALEQRDPRAVGIAVRYNYTCGKRVIENARLWR